MNIQSWPIERLIPYARNPRKNDHAIEQMMSAIQEFGFAIPVLARSSGEIVDGHLRWKAARKLGYKELPVIACDEWTEAQVKAFRLLANRSVTWASWDEELLALEFEELQELNFDLSFTGFEGREIDEILFDHHGDDSQQEDVIPEVALTAVTRTGDVWICGPHRVLCGDATNQKDVSSLLCSVVPVLMTTDPPYGVSYAPGWREEAGLGRQRQIGLVANDDRVDWSEAFQLFGGDVAYVWHAGLHSGEVAASLRTAGFEVRSQIIWAKQHFALSRGDYHWQHEPCWYAVRRGKSSQWRGDRTQSTLWQVPNLNPFGGNKSEDIVTGHGTQKPVELMRRPILNHSERGEGIYDPFLGSGTTLVSAESTGRICYGVEIEPAYVDTAVCRWQSVTGVEATLAATGETFDAIRKKRLSSWAGPLGDDRKTIRIGEEV